jgi:MurNAc alpha-1-phosphate uridylyltransferase
MQAMILAAGGGTRLRPLTETIPKALVPLAGRPLLGWVMDRIVRQGATRIVINVHHHSEQIRAYLESHTTSGVEILLSPEPDGPYDTGGGLFAAAPLFRAGEPILLHNVDVLSGVPLGRLLAEHSMRSGSRGSQPVASLAVQDRDSRRRLLFDAAGLLGWENRGSDRAPEGARRARPSEGEVYRRAFTGIHVVAPSIFQLSSRKGTFSIIQLYLQLVEQGHTVLPVDVTESPWVDVGTPERLVTAERMVRSLGGE